MVARGHISRASTMCVTRTDTRFQHVTPEANAAAKLRDAWDLAALGHRVDGLATDAEDRGDFLGLQQ